VLKPAIVFETDGLHLSYEFPESRELHTNILPNLNILMKRCDPLPWTDTNKQTEFDD